MSTRPQSARFARASPARAGVGPLAIAALLSAEAGCVHLAYTQIHWLQWWGYGALFLAAAIGQLLFPPLLLRRPTTLVILGGIACNLAVIVMYFLSRTSGLPFGPHANGLEPAGAIDLATTAGEVGLVVVLLGMLDRPCRRLLVNALLVAAAGAWVLRLTGNLG